MAKKGMKRPIPNENPTYDTKKRNKNQQPVPETKK